MGRVTVVVKDMARTGAAIVRAAGTLRRGGALVTRAAVAVSWNPDLPGVLAPLGVTPVAALDLADLRASWRTRNVPAAP